VAYAWSAQAFHGATYANAALLLLLLVVQLTVPLRSTRARVVFSALAVVCGLITGLDVMSDALLAVTGIIPYVVASEFIALRSRRLQPWYVPVPLVVATALGAGITVLLAHHLQLSDTPLPVHLSLSHVGPNTRILGAGVAAIFTASIPAASHGYGYLGAAIVLVLGVGCAAILARAVLRFGEWSLVRTAVLVFCAVSVLCLLAAFLFTDAPQDATAFRYLVAGYVFVAAGLPILVAPVHLARPMVSAVRPSQLDSLCRGDQARRRVRSLRRFRS
jgi:hypothetical protein